MNSSDECSSSIGMSGDRQHITLGPHCGALGKLTHFVHLFEIYLVDKNIYAIFCLFMLIYAYLCRFLLNAYSCLFMSFYAYLCHFMPFYAILCLFMPTCLCHFYAY